MDIADMTFIGIDPTAGRSPFTYTAVDPDCRLLTLAAGELDELLAFLNGQQYATVAVNAPPRPNFGLVRKKLEKQGIVHGHQRGADVRLAEYELHTHGIVVSPTPARLEYASAWMQMGFDLYLRLEKMGYKPYPAEKAERQVLETHPHASFCALLGQMPLSKPTLEGRLQRQLILHEMGMGIKDPMDFFEEITRHKLLGGGLPMEFIYLPEELDALVAAYTAYVAANESKEVTLLGAKEEGRIVLPVGELKERY